MRQIDLHVHSTCSDGTDSPAVLVDKAVDKGLAAFALTDHDTTRGVKEALLACKKANNNGHKLEVIPGVEISTNYDNTEIHVVGLFVNYNDNEFNSFLNKQLSSRDERNKRVCERPMVMLLVPEHILQTDSLQLELLETEMKHLTDI